MIRKHPQFFGKVDIFVVVIKGNLETVRILVRHIAYVVFMASFPCSQDVLSYLHLMGWLIWDYCGNVPDAVRDPVAVIKQYMYLLFFD